MEGTASIPHAVPTAPAGPEAVESDGPTLDFRSPLDPHRRVAFERVYIEGVTDRPIPPVDDYDHGTGVALLDFDGDGDLDLFLGASDRGPMACLFENQSEPGSYDFPLYRCFPDIPWAAGGFGVDVNLDGRHELVITGPDVATLVQLEPYSATNLLGLVEERDACAAGAVASHDVDLDGRPDLFVGCHATHPGIGVLPNFALRQSETGWEPFSFPIGGVTEEENTLALAVLDVDDDGLLDLVTVDDTYSNEFGRRVLNFPGGIRRRCTPLEDCVDQLWYMAEGPERWGSFMGAGNVWVEEIGECLFLTDWGRNRLVRFDEGVGSDWAIETGLGLGAIDIGPLRYDLGFDGLLPLFSWGVTVDDFDFDGRDDLFVTQGLVPSLPGDDAFSYHFQLLGLQTEPGRFELLSAIAGVDVPTRADAYPADHPTSSRGVVKTDLDGDGVLELIIAPQSGFVQIYRQAPSAGPLTRRCTIRPHNWAVPSYGFGYGVASRAAPTRFYRRDIGGQLLSGTSPWVLSADTAGTFRFPSGYAAPFDCEDGVAIDLVEPEWLSIETEGGTATIRADFPGLQMLEIYGRTDTGDVRLLGAGERSEMAVDVLSVEAVVIRINERWVARWWEL